jgi:DNA uptake protein ComE-like DNA-binding protein
MLRLFALLTIATVGALVFAMLGAPEDADAHAAAKPGTVAGQVGKVAPASTSANRPSAQAPAEQPLAPRPASVAAAPSSPQAKSTDRNFLLRPTAPVGADMARLAATSHTAAPASDQPKAHVERVGSAPATNEPASPPSRRLAAVDSAVQPPPPVSGATARTNLNTASVDDLNRLGGGMIGKAIARGRPYASSEDLLHKRVVSRATFDRIKSRVSAN